jgi:6-phosphogluconate dehydrogenase
VRVGLIGLGKMGGRMVGRLVAAGHEVVGVDLDAAVRIAAVEEGAEAHADIAAMLETLEAPRAIWVMTPAGVATQAVLEQLAEQCTPGDLVVDGGNSDFRDAPARAALLSARGIRFVDAGVSGGQWGWQHGYGITLGGAAGDIAQLEPVLRALAAPDAFARVGEVGAGHLVKAVHNAVEYGVMQAYAEGFALLAAQGDLDTLGALTVWQRGCSVRSFLLEQTVVALTGNPSLDGVSSQVADSGMGRWTAQEAVRLAVATPVLTAALQARFASRDQQHAGSRLLTAARGQIGGHATHV